MPDEIMIDKNMKLRRITVDDAEALFHIIREDPGIGKSVTWPASVQNLEDTRQGIRQLSNRENLYPYVLQEKGTTIGYAGAWDSQYGKNEIGFSYFLAKSKRGRGFVNLAVKNLMSVVKQVFPVDMFVVYITEGNEPSKAVAMKLGFKSTDKLRYDKALKKIIRRYERPVQG